MAAAAAAADRNSPMMTLLLLISLDRPLYGRNNSRPSRRPPCCDVTCHVTLQDASK